MAPTNQRTSLRRAAKDKVTSYAIPGDAHKVRKPRQKKTAPIAPAPAPRRRVPAVPAPQHAPIQSPPPAMHFQSSPGRGRAGVCEICGHDILPANLPKEDEIPSRCWPHIKDVVCRPCIVRYLREDMGHFFRVACALCGNPWDVDQIMTLLSAEDIARYETRLTGQALEQNPHFRWCAQEKCTYGQLFDESQVSKDPKVCCHSCEAVNCFACRVPWHEGKTCNQHSRNGDDEKKEVGKEDVSVMAMRKNETRHCPFCNVGVEKTYGCAHIVCSNCNRDFNWENARRV